jgi:chromosome segregation and condensation protein ScpB
MPVKPFQTAASPRPHRDILGHPMLYGTTKKFLEVLGLNSLKDLPKAEELKKPE